MTANNAIVDASYPYYLADHWDPGFRAERAAEGLLERGEDGLTLDDMTELQVDTAMGRARNAAIWLMSAEPATDDGRIVLDRILDWDGACDIDSLGCAAWSMFEYRAAPRRLRRRPRTPRARLRRYAARPDADRRTLRRPRSDLVGRRVHAEPARPRPRSWRARLDEAGSSLTTSYGPPTNWTWGRVHTATFQEATIGSSGIAPLEWYFNDGPHAVAGAYGALDNTYYRFSRAYPDPLDPDYHPVGPDRVFDVTNLPSLRFAIDMTDLDGARIVITTGQSGNPFDRHYNDMIDPWLNGETVPLPFTAGGHRRGGRPRRSSSSRERPRRHRRGDDGRVDGAPGASAGVGA